MSSTTPKQQVKAAEPKARLDFYEALRGSGDPCWFIRVGFQGPALSSICASPRAAWVSALMHIRVTPTLKAGAKGADKAEKGGN